MEAIKFQREFLMKGVTFFKKTGIAAMLLAGIGVAEAQKAGDASGGPQGIASREAARRGDLLQKSQRLLQEGEQLRASEDFSGAIEKYRGALALLPKAPVTLEMRDTVFARFQGASIKLAKSQIEEARYEDAEATLTAVIVEARNNGFAPGVISDDLKTQLKRVKSGDYYNKALSPEHLTKTRVVEEELLLAAGHSGIGNYDKANEAYSRVLNLDPYNEAARRGKENVERLKKQYADVARASTRATFLSQVDASWELPVPPQVNSVNLLGDAGPELTSSEGVIKIREKLSNIIIPSVEFLDTPLESVVEFLVQRSIELDASEPDPTKKGVNIIFGASSGEGARSIPITLSLSNTPLGVVLGYALNMGSLEYRVDQYAVTIGQLGSSKEKGLITRTFVVPPDFLRSGGGGGGADAGADPFQADPFAADQPQTGSLVQRQTAEEYLKSRGVEFPEGARAVFIAATSTLVVRNTSGNIDLIESLVLAAQDAGTKQVQIDVISITISEEGLRELGYDTLLGGSNFPGSDRIFTSGGTSGNQEPRSRGDFSIVEPGGPAVGETPLSAGLRFGDISNNVTIDDVITRDSPTTVTSTSSPSVFSLAGVFTDPQFQIAIRALSQHKSSDRLDQASIVTLPGQRAVIRQVREFIYPTEYDPPEVPNSSGLLDVAENGGETLTAIVGGPVVATPATPTAFESRDVGTVLEVEPLVGADNFTIDLNVAADMTDFSGFINYGTPITDGTNTITENRILMPVFDAIKNTTNVSIYDGATVAIGGLINESRTDVEDKVPFLGDLPGVGRLFRTAQEEGSKRAIMLFVTVKLLDSAGRPLNQFAGN